MDKFYIEILNGKVGNQYRLYEPRMGRVFFILKENNGVYDSSYIIDYEPIVNELKEWIIKIKSENVGNLHLKSFSYDEIIKTMFRAYKREERLKELFDETN